MFLHCYLGFPRLISTPQQSEVFFFFCIVQECHFFPQAVDELGEKVTSELWSNVCKSLTCSAWSFYSVLYWSSTSLCWTECHFCENRNVMVWLWLCWAKAFGDFLDVFWPTLSSVQSVKDCLNRPWPFSFLGEPLPQKRKFLNISCCCSWVMGTLSLRWSCVVWHPGV